METTTETPAEGPAARPGGDPEPAVGDGGAGGGRPARRISRLTWALVACVAAGLVLRALEARTSLWLDELHTLYVAAAPSVSELSAILERDTHTPLYYVAVQLASGVLDGAALRWVSIVGGLLALAPLLGLARASGFGTAARVAVAGLFCTLPFQVQWGAELRPYAWFQVFVVVLAWAAFTPATTTGARRGRFAAFALATAAGLYTHPFTAIAVAGVGAARVVVRRAGWLSWSRLAGAALVGAVLFLPWLASAHPWLFREPWVLWTDENGPPASASAAATDGPGALQQDERALARDAEVDAALAEASALERNWSRQKLLQVPLQLLVPRMSELGGASAGLARAALAGLVLALATLVVVALRAHSRSAGGLPREIVGAALAAALSAVLLGAVCILLVNRIPLQYFVLAAWAWPLVFGALVQRAPERLRAPATAVLLVLGALGGVAQVTGAPREDMRRGALTAVQEALERDAWLTAILWQPSWYEHGTAFRVWAPDSDWLEPEDVPRVGEEGGDRTVVILTRNAPDRGITNWLCWRPVQTGRERTAVLPIDRAVAVYVYDAR